MILPFKEIIVVIIYAHGSIGITTASYEDYKLDISKEKPLLCKEEKLTVEINCPIAFNYAVPAPDT